MGGSGSERITRAISGERLTPPARGLTFVDPTLLPGPGTAGRLPAAALAHSCAELGLDFAFVPSWELWALDAVSELDAVGVAAFWVVPGVWWPSLESLGVEKALRLSARQPAALAATMERFVPQAIWAAHEGIEVGADALVVADDLAGDAGPMASPALMAAEVFPRLARIAASASHAGVPAFLHCDGDTRSLLGLIHAAGFSALHGDCGGAARIESALAAASAEGVALIGGLPTTSLTSPARGASTGRAAALLARHGGLLIADDGGLTAADEVGALVSALVAAGGA